VEELGFHLLDRRDMASCREVQCEALGICITWENKASGVACRVGGYSFPPISGESVVLIL
jgi:hypothetical protein